MAAAFTLTFAGVPFAVPGKTLPDPEMTQGAGEEFQSQESVDLQYNPDTIKWIDEEIRQWDMLETLPLPPFAGKNIYGNANPNWYPRPPVGVGQFYYPHGMSRWSMFHGLTTADMANAMVSLALQGGASAKPFTLSCAAVGPSELNSKTYSITTPMYMLTPRPLTGAGVSGLYLVTLVDSRYRLQYAGATIKPSYDNTWVDVLLAIAADLGIELSIPAILPVYLSPEPDSQLWTNIESAVQLLDAVAANIGMRVVRNYDDTYRLQDVGTAATLITLNRGKIVNMAGGGLYDSSAAANDTVSKRNAVVPAGVSVSFPKYATSPRPYFVNSRYKLGPRPSAWIEDSYGDVFIVDTSLAAAGFNNIAGFPSVKFLHSTAKALLTNETDLVPSNSTDLKALGLQLSKDFYAWQLVTSLDEVVPGTLAWQPEAVHDVLWTYRSAEVSTRVFRSAWNYNIVEFQHSSGAALGVGGRSIPLTVTDGASPFYGINLLQFPGATINQIYDLAGLAGVEILTRCCSTSIGFTDHITTGAISLQDQYIGAGDKWFDGVAFGPALSSGLPDETKSYHVENPYPFGFALNDTISSGIVVSVSSLDVQLLTGNLKKQYVYFVVANIQAGACGWAYPFNNPTQTPIIVNSQTHPWSSPNSLPAETAAFIDGCWVASCAFGVGGGSSPNRLLFTTVDLKSGSAGVLLQSDPNGVWGTASGGSLGSWYYTVLQKNANGVGPGVLVPTGLSQVATIAAQQSSVVLNWIAPNPGDTGVSCLGYSIRRNFGTLGSGGTFNPSGHWDIVADINNAAITTYTDTGTATAFNSGQPPVSSSMQGGTNTGSGTSGAGIEVGIDGSLTPGTMAIVKGGIIVQIGSGGGFPAMTGSQASFSGVTSTGTITAGAPVTAQATGVTGYQGAFQGPFAGGGSR